MFQPDEVLRDPHRLAAIEHSGLRESLRVEAFDRLTRLAARLLHTPVALVSLLTDERHHVIGDFGLAAPWHERRELPMTHSFCRHVISGEPLVVDDAAHHPLVCGSPAIPDLGVRAYVGLPLTLSDGRTLGSFCVLDAVPRQWTASELEALRDLAAVAAAEVEARVRAGEAADARRALDETEARFHATFEQAAVGIAHIAPGGRWLRVNRRLCEIIGYERGALLARTFQELTHPDDLTADLDQLRRLVAGELPWYRREKRYLHRDGHPVWAMITVSLVRDAAGRPDYFIVVAEDIEERKRAEAALRDAQAEVLERLAQAADVRDDATGRHTRRVGELSARLAAALGLEADQVTLIRQAAPLHDVGKIGVPDAVLLKPAALSPEERARMQAHTVDGAALLGGSAAPLTRLAETIALAHHERWDGGGYPRCLAGEAIPLAARIVAVADVYDALTHDRPYRPAWPEARAADFIREGAGTHFDPAVVDAFLRLRPATKADVTMRA